ncbi:MAG: hypothetical protein ACYC5F_05980 [Thermoleophilia bacterium]
MERIPVKYCRGETNFTREGKSSEITLLDFWAWAFSDVVTNTTRGILAEFIVATALGLNIVKPRDCWAKYDLEYKGAGIEIKSSAYHQRWRQKEMSPISFSVPKSRAWESETGEMESESRRQADIYVLSLLAERDREAVNPINLDQWRFWIIETSFFNERKRSQDSITYNSLISERGEPVSYSDIKSSVDALISKMTASPE